jgi:hypothetical protein
MVDSVPRWKVLEWRAYHDLIGSESWQQTEVITRAIKELRNAIRAVNGLKPIPLEPGENIPLIRDVEEQAEGQDGVAALGQALDRAFGADTKKKG